VNWEHTGEGVWTARDEVVLAGPPQVERLLREAAAAPKKRARLCAHAGPDARVHEMLIAFRGDTYVRPHRHLDKSESFHVVTGRARVVIFSNDGRVERLIELGPPGSGHPFFFRIASPLYHTLLLDGDELVLHETTSGPFVRGDAEFPDWAPAETEPPDVLDAYKRSLTASSGRDEA